MCASAATAVFAVGACQVSQEFPPRSSSLRRYDVSGDDNLDALASGYELVKYQDTDTLK